ncbi:MAG: hypothetical protein ACR2MY_14950 [Candidatus Dormibacteria bacterium]
MARWPLPRGSAAWRHLASEVLAERQRYHRRPAKAIAAQVRNRTGLPVDARLVYEVEAIYGRPDTGTRTPDSTRHAIRPVRLKNTHNPFSKETDR